ncbi:MAG: sugar ABC transporter substrate-binding protein [Anaerolineae bacterium]|jgi:multiple sugar transport system substrate-binding protein|nr:sugar ABC transporter substrate-binding protein [Anaerolineae bacterium]
MVHRVLRFVILLVLLVAVFGTQAQETAPVQLTFVGWGGPEEIEVFTQLTEAFNANNSDVQIIYEHIPGDYVAALNTRVAAQTPPDIAYIPDGDFYSFASREQLVNIQDLVDASEMINEDEIWASALGRYRFDPETNTSGEGDLYALPKDIGPTLVFVNTELFEAAGVELPDPNTPLTWDQVVEIGTQLTFDSQGLNPDDEGFNPNDIVQWGIGDLFFENIIYGNGGRIVSEDGREFVMADDANAIEALQWISDLDHVYNIRPPAETASSIGWGALFEQGRVAMTTAGRWATTNFRNVLTFNWDVIPNFVGPSGELTVYPGAEDCTFSGWSGSVGLAIMRNSAGEEHRELAFRFIEFLVGTEGQTEQAALGFQIPNQIELADSDVFLQPDQAPANAQVFLEAARCQRPGPWTETPLYGQWFNDSWWNGVWPAVVNDNTELAEDALADRAESFQEALDEAWASVEN